MRKGFIHIVETIIIVIMMFLVIWQFTYIPGAKTEWSRTKLVLQGNDILFSLDRKGIDWSDSEEVETEFNKHLNQTNILYDLKLRNVIKPRIIVGCICNNTEFATTNEILKPFGTNGRWVNFTLDQIQPSDQPEQYLSEIYDIVLLWDFNLTGYEQVSAYLKADKGIVEIRDLNADEINNWGIQKTFFGLQYNDSLSPPGAQDVAFTELVSYANSTYYNIFKYFYHTPNSTGGLIEEPYSFPDFLGDDEKISPRDGDERRIILMQRGSNSSALIVNQGMGNGFGRTAWLSGYPGLMSEEMKVLIRDLVVWAAGDTYRVVPNEITINPVIFSLYKVFKPKGLVGQWDFDEGEDQTAHDTSGNVNHGDIIGADWVDGKAGNALEFNGVGDYVIVPDSTGLRISAYSVEVWIKPSVDTDYWTGVIGKPGRNFNFWLGESDDPNGGFVHHRFHDEASTNSGCSNTGADSIPMDTWSHIVITNNGTTCKTYINGNEEASGSVTGSLIIDNTDLYIGRNLDGASGNYFNGTIDQVRIYNRALSLEEIEGLHDFPGQDMFQPMEVVLTLGYVY